MSTHGCNRRTFAACSIVAAVTLSSAQWNARGQLRAVGGVIEPDSQVDSTLVVSGRVASSPEDVWALFTTARGLESWMVPRAEVDLRIGGYIRTNYHENGTIGDQNTIENRIIALHPGRMLAFQNVKAPEGFEDPEVYQQTWTVVYFTPMPDGATYLESFGLGYGADEASQRLYEKFKAGNEWTLEQLQEFVSPGETDEPESRTGGALRAGVDPGAGDLLADAAMILARGEVDTCLSTLNALFEAGYPSPSRVLADPRFNPLRERSETRSKWRSLMREHVVESHVTMVTPDEPGVPMLIEGKVVRTPDGHPVPGAVLELYHTDSSGTYEPGDAIGDDKSSRLFCFVRTADDGTFDVLTIKPEPYPGASPGAAHVHFVVKAPGYRDYAGDFRPYDHPLHEEERRTALERGYRVTTVREVDGVLTCEVSIPMKVGDD